MTWFDCAKEAINRMMTNERERATAIAYIIWRVPKSQRDEEIPPDKTEALIAKAIGDFQKGWRIAQQEEERN